MIKNFAKIIRNGCGQKNREARELLLKACQTVISEIDPAQLIKRQVKLKDNELLIQNRIFNLDNFESIYVIGAGKAGKTMAKALTDILANRIKNGVVNYPGDKDRTGNIHLNPAAHPTPDIHGQAGAKAILQLAKNAGENDLIISLISGGGSSLLPLPANGISLEQKIETTRLLLESGADITEINSVRKHISAIKGGQLAKAAYPATLVNLILSDVIGDPLDCIASGPTVPDPSTYADAIGVLKKHNLAEQIPGEINEILAEGADGQRQETPEANAFCFNKAFNFVLGNNHSAIDAAADFFARNKIEVVKLKQFAKINAEKAAEEFSNAALKLKQGMSNRSIPVAIISGGEANVKVEGKGLGGRVQEMALASVEALKNSDGIILCYFATDGIDGPTDSAGAIVDGETFVHSMMKGLQPANFRVNNDSYHFFEQIGDLIFTGYTGSNVNDLYLGFIY
ncbi:MAG: glycerate kinase type-2 family protein [Candidatus Rifleibacteriota bacterium]